MILVTAEFKQDELEKKLENYEQIYLFISKIQENVFADICQNKIYLLLASSDDYFKLCFELILAINSENLIAKLYISQSNEAINLNGIDLENNNYQVFEQNKSLRKTCNNQKLPRKNKHFMIRAYHPTLDNILYPLSVLCFKYERNLELLYDKYYLNLTQSQVAEKYKISQVAVSKKLRSSSYEIFKTVVDRL